MSLKINQSLSHRLTIDYINSLKLVHITITDSLCTATFTCTPDDIDIIIYHLACELRSIDEPVRILDDPRYEIIKSY